MKEKPSLRRRRRDPQTRTIRTNVSRASSYDDSVAWVILLLVLIAAAFGVLGAVIKLTAIIVLAILLSIAALVAIVWYSFRSQLRRWERNGIDGGTQVRTWSRGHRSPPRDLPSHDDRY
jgi:Flp pilus assembly protein TadB